MRGNRDALALVTKLETDARRAALPERVIHGLQLWVPIRVHSPNHPTGRRHARHWGPQHRQTRQQRNAVRVAWERSDPHHRLVLPLPAAVKLVRVAPRELDGHDNLRAAFKHVVDEITALLGLSNDRDARVIWNYTQERGGVREYGIRIVVVNIAPEG